MKRLTEERELRHWSKAGLARRANLNPSTVGQIENGRLQPYDGQLAKIAKALGWVGSADALLEEVDQ